jgi:hypothetical protein
MPRSADAFARTFLASVMTVSIGCGAGVDLPVQPLPQAEQMRFQSGMATPQRLVIRDPASWATVWPQIVGPHRPILPVPPVDFTRDVVVIAAMGTRPTGSYSIDVEDVRLYPDEASISVREQSPGARCIVTDVVTAPIAVVLVPSFAGPATFVEHASQLPCE